MLDDPLMDPMGALVLELRGDADVASLVSTRVRGGEPAEGDARGPGNYQAFVVLTGAPVPLARVPVSRSLYGVRCYGVTFQNATAVWSAVVKALHFAGARLKANGLGIYITAIEQAAEPVRDPDTDQPYIEGTIRIIATAQAIT